MQASLHQRFVSLHQGNAPLLLVNCWDAASARLWQELGAPAIATSSAAVAWSRGYADGGALPREALLDSLRDIVRVTSVPITVDVENGYSDDPQAVAELIADVAGAGAIGINLEDGTGTPEQLAAKIRAIRAHLGNASLFINARTDVYLRKMASGEAAIGMTTERLQMYGAAGADGGFVPLLADVDAAARIAAKVPLALNVMTVPALPSLTALHAAGVRRVSTGPFLFRVAYGAAQQAARAFLDGDPALLYASSLEGGTLNGLFSARR